MDFDPHREKPEIVAKRSLPMSWRTSLLWLVPYLLAVLIMLPRLQSPQFGLLDDGNSLRTARLLAGGDWQLADVAAGRSRPLYWLFWSLPYLIAGPSPFAYFLANLAALLVLVTCVIVLCRELKMGSLSSWMAVVIFLLIGPVVENFYTLSKGEPLQLILILLGLFLALSRSGSGFSPRVWTAGVFIPILTFLSGITKETTLVMIPISLVWLVAANRSGPSRGWVDRTALRTALVGFTVGGVLFLVYRVATVGPELVGSGYASGFDFSIARILDSSSRWSAWLLRDFLFLLPLSVMPLIWWRLGERPSRGDLIVGGLIWMVGWMVIFLPWLFVAEYYLLPLSFGAALVAAVLVGDALAIMRRKASARVSTSALLAVAAVLFCANLINLSTVARLQLAVDEANAAVVEFLASKVPQEGTVLVNIQEPTEYMSQIRLHLIELYGRTDIHIVPLDVASLADTDLSGGVLIASPYIENQVLLSDRLGVYEPNVLKWNKSIIEFLRAHSEDRYHSSWDVPGLSFDPARAVCPLFAGAQEGSPTLGLPVESIIHYCQGGALIDRRTFSYGWDVYLVDRP